MIHWGIIGAGNIARRFIEGLSYSKEGKLYAIASYTKEKREYYQKEFSNIQVYDDYKKLLEDDTVDAVYIATRHNDHYQWAKEALKKHKAVLCEKPATLYYHQTKELCDLAMKHDTFFMEAMKTRFVPLINDIRTLLDQGVLGDIISIETCFAYCVGYRPGHYLHDREQGGILNDVGSYNLASILDYIDESVVNITSKVQFQDEVDVNDKIELTFESGKKAFIDIACNENKEKKMVIKGTLGTLEATPFYRPTKATISLNDKEPYVIERPYVFDDFYTEIEEVHHCMKQHQIQSKRMSFEDSLKMIKLTEKIRETFKK